MFYLKYRPRTIEEIDNSQVRESIENILKAKNLPHAFLFIGQKGTGKTSTARIIAKSVNCLKRKGLEPCNSCKNCSSIDSSSSVDVVELDAASNRGIDEIRNLIRESSFSPMTGNYRVFIIDEAHMITSDAFNALLKTLEEPPPSVIFILATTNLEKVPKTITSRCFLINFGRAKQQDILRMLKRVSEDQRIEIDDKTLKLIIKHSENSFRDAAKILEELQMQDKLVFTEAEKFLGLVGKQDLLEILEKKDLKSALSWIEEFSQSGGNFKSLIEQLLDDLRILLLIKNKVIQAEDDLTYNFTSSQITQLMKLLSEAYNNLRIAPIESIPLEIAVADFYNLNSA